MAKARPLRKAGRKTGAKSVKNRRGPSAELKRPTAKRPVKPATRAAARKPVSPSPVRRKAAVAAADRPMASPEIPPPLPAPIASFTF
jgi:hypothetical protein